MTPHDRALELMRLAKRDENAAHVLQADSSIDAATIGFHYQQAVGKLLKALLAERNIDFPRTHDLAGLVELVESAGYRVPVAEDELAALTPFAVTFRYGTDEETEHLDKDWAETLLQQLREWVERELG
jgi:HEPN domain-containing protein